jgi:peroxiredoxin family protein
MLQEAEAGVALSEDDVRRIVREEIEAGWKRDPAAGRAAIIASKGTLDWAYPPLIVGTAAAASGMDTTIFFTFYGLRIITKGFEETAKVGTTGNPAMPMPIPMADLFAGFPGMKAVGTRMMRAKFTDKGVSTIGELLGVAGDLGVRLVACRMTMDVFGFEESDFIDGVEFGGAAAFVSAARRAHLTLFV